MHTSQSAMRFHRIILAAALAAALGSALWTFGLSVQLLLAVLFLGWLALVAAIDLQTHRIPNRLTYPALLLTPVVTIAWPLNPFGQVFGAIVCGGFFFAAFLLAPSALGFGDVKLAVVIGLYLGWPWAVAALVAGTLCGGLLALLVLVAGGGRRSYMPYGPALAAGGALALLRTFGMSS